MKNLIECDQEMWLADSDSSLPHPIVEPLMKSAARHCKSYKSDLYLELVWMSRDVQKLASGRFEGVYRRAIGFRDGGVDHPNFVKSVLDAGGDKTFKVLYAFQAERVMKGETEYIHMTLGRLSVAEMRLWLEEHFDVVGDQKRSEFHPQGLEEENA